MSKCIKCGCRFVGIPEQPTQDHLCKYCEITELRQTVKDFSMMMGRVLHRLRLEPHSQDLDRLIALADDLILRKGKSSPLK